MDSPSEKVCDTSRVTGMPVRPVVMSETPMVWNVPAVGAVVLAVAATTTAASADG